jgi:very-short-patch-repair endonuclease
MGIKNEAHILLAKHLRELGLIFATEVRFHPERRWRWDFTLPAHRIALEIEGATWVAGRHTRGKGYQADCDKANHGTMLGWRLLRFTTQDVLRGRAKAFLREYL